MSEDVKIHHISERPFVRGYEVTDDWTKVTCDSCKLERPLVKPAEHRVSADVLQRDALLVALDRLTEAVESVRKALEGPGQGAAPVNAVSEPADLSARAMAVLLSVPGWEMGACPQTPMGPAVRDELRTAGMLGSAGGLTRKGSIWKERQDRASLDALFGKE